MNYWKCFFWFAMPQFENTSDRIVDQIENLRCKHIYSVCNKLKLNVGDKTIGKYWDFNKISDLFAVMEINIAFSCAHCSCSTVTFNRPFSAKQTIWPFISHDESSRIALSGGNIQNIHFQFRLNIRNKSCFNQIHENRVIRSIEYGQCKNIRYENR